MIASFHAIRYRRRVVVPPKKLAGRVEGLRFWRPFDIGGDFAYFREHPTRRALYPTMRPDFRRWAYYAVWDDESALEGFLDGHEVAQRWWEGAAEAWHLWMQPLAARGSWAGVADLIEGRAEPPAGAPVAHLVRLDLTLRGALVMWGSAAPHVLPHLAPAEEMLAGIPLVDRPYTQPCSFTVWRSAAHAVAFAYRRPGHRDAVARMRRAQKSLMERYATAQFLPYRSEGSWQGRNPLADRLAVTSPSIHSRRDQ